MEYQTINLYIYIYIIIMVYQTPLFASCGIYLTIPVLYLGFYSRKM